MNGHPHWPCCVWSLCDVSQANLPAVLATHTPSKVLVRFYGALEYTWLRPAVLTPYEPGAAATQRKLARVPRADSKRCCGATARQQVAARVSAGGAAEVARLAALGNDSVRCQLQALVLFFQVYLLRGPLLFFVRVPAVAELRGACLWGGLERVRPSCGGRPTFFRPRTGSSDLAFG